MLKRILLLLLLLVSLKGYTQIQVVTTFLNTYNVNALTVCRSTVNSQLPATRVFMEAGLTDENGNAIITVRTNPFTLNHGINNISLQQGALSSAIFASNELGQYVVVNHRLPSGAYRQCIKIISVSGETMGEYCNDMESIDNNFLTLVDPYDRDTIDTQNPLLTWSHSEPFSALLPSQYFKLILVEMDRKDQEADEAIMIKIPHYIYDNIRTHQDLYPSNANVLEEGKTYAWQIQKISATDNAVIEKSEAWVFTVRKPKIVQENKYCVLKEKVDGDYYTAVNDKIYFQFEEDYYSESIKCKVYDTKHKLLVPQVFNETIGVAASGASAMNAKTIGYNAYELDLSDYKLKSGYYYMEVMNEKNKTYILKFYVD